MAKAAHTTREIMAIMAIWPGVTALDGFDALLSPSSPEIITASLFPSSSRLDVDEGVNEGADEGESDGDREAGAVVSTWISVSVWVSVDPPRPLDTGMLGMDMDMDILM
jgi:hypothetical protein